MTVHRFHALERLLTTTWTLIAGTSLFAAGFWIGALTFVVLPWLISLTIGDGYALDMRWITPWNWLAEDGGRAAAWVQAFGSVTAIFIAIWISRQEWRNQIRIQKIDRLYRAQSLASILLPHFLGMNLRIHTLMDEWPQDEPSEKQNYWERNCIELLSVVEIPASVREHQRDWHLLGADAQFLYRLDELREALRVMVPRNEDCGNPALLSSRLGLMNIAKNTIQHLHNCVQQLAVSLTNHRDGFQVAEAESSN